MSMKRESKKEEQPTLPGIPEITTHFYRVNFQYMGPNYALRQGSLVIPAERIEVARAIAQETIDAQRKGWNNIVSIVQLKHEEAPF